MFKFKNLLEGVPAHELPARRKQFMEAVSQGAIQCRLGDLRESIGSDFFDSLTLDAMHKRALKGLTGFPGADAYRRLATIKPVSDFRLQYGVRLGNYGTLPSKPEGGRYQIDTPTDEKASYKVGEFGKMEAFTFQAMANDELGMLGNWAERMGQAAARKRNSFFFGDLIQANPTCTYDSVALFHANHNNLLSSATLGYSALKELRKKIRNQTGLDGEPLNLEPDTLIVHPDQEEDAFRLVNSGVIIVGDRDTTATAQTDIPQTNFHQKKYEIIVTPYIDSGDFYMACKPGQCDTIELGFLRGFENPQMSMEKPDSSHEFETDSKRAKVHDVYGGTPLDHRWIAQGAA